MIWGGFGTIKFLMISTGCLPEKFLSFLSAQKNWIWGCFKHMGGRINPESGKNYEDRLVG